MSLLTPLYLLGLAAVSLPILFHLIRRTPRGRQLFSSLMFLAPSPPRLTRRSRVEHWLLLLLRATALILLALAFARPFLRQVANLSLSNVRVRRIAILVDTSASMQRPQLWQQALAKLNATLDQLGPHDDVSLHAFDRDMRTIVAPLEATTRERGPVADLVRERAAGLKPSWHHTDLGSALIAVAEELAVVGDDPDQSSVAQIVVISDLQQGADLNAMQGYEWPEHVLVSIETVQSADPSNASLSVLRAEDEPAADQSTRVRITNVVDSRVDQFEVGWSRGDADRGDTRDKTMPVYVPAGQSRVVQLPPPDPSILSDRLTLQGDPALFDNTFYVVPQIQDQVELIYLGSDRADDPDGLRYYLQLALHDTPQRKVNIVPAADEAFVAPRTETRLVVVTSALTDEQFTQLTDYVRDGGTLLALPRDAESAAAVAAHFPSWDFVTRDAETGVKDYLLLVDIDFAHPLFKPFATPRYSDFTKIHFWNHQRFQLDEEGVRILARFDNGDPAMWEQALGAGRVFALASGWRPDESQLALSSKFVPLLNTLLDQAAGSPIDFPSFYVGQPIPLPELRESTAVTKPDGSVVPLESQSRWFRDADQPGIYTISHLVNPIRFAVNLSPRESETSLLDLEQLEELGVHLGRHATQAEELERQRQLRDIELESQQQLWRWLIVVVLGVLGLETWLAGRRSRAPVNT